MLEPSIARHELQTVRETLESHQTDRFNRVVTLTGIELPDELEALSYKQVRLCQLISHWLTDFDSVALLTSSTCSWLKNKTYSLSTI